MILEPGQSGEAEPCAHVCLLLGVNDRKGLLGHLCVCPSVPAWLSTCARNKNFPSELWLPAGAVPVPRIPGSSSHSSFLSSGLALPFVCFSQVSLQCVHSSAVCFGRDQTIANPPSRNPALIFSSLLTGWGLATGKGIIGKAGVTAGAGGVALVAVCSHLLKVLIKEPEFLEVCEWLGGADWSGREIVLMYRN